MEGENQENNNQQPEHTPEPVQPVQSEPQPVAQPVAQPEPVKPKKKFSFPKLKMPEQAMKQADNIKMPKLKMPTPGRIKRKIKEYHRVLKITKKPSTAEYKAIVKASGLGIVIIGGIGFIIHMIVQAIQLLN